MKRHLTLVALIAVAAGLLLAIAGLAEPPALKKAGANSDSSGTVPPAQKLLANDEDPAKAPPKKETDGKPPLEPLEKFKQLLPKDQPPGQTAKGPNQGEDPKDIARVAKNMETSEDHLKNRKTDQETQSVQKKIIEDLEKLINQEQKNQESKNKSQSQKKSSSKDQQNKDNSKPDNKQKQPDQGDKEPAKTTQQDKDKKGMSGATDLTGDKNGSSGADNTVSGLVKDIWGHLPKAKRQEMEAYSHEKFMPQYEQLLRQYYQNIAAQKKKSKGGE